MSLEPDPIAPGPAAGRAMRVLRNEEFVRCLGQAVRRVLVREAQDENRALRVTRDVVRAFFALAQRRTRLVRGMTQSQFLSYLRRSQAELVEQRERALGELRGLRADLSSAKAGLAEWTLDEEAEREAGEALARDLAVRSPELASVDVEELVARERARRRQLFARALAVPRERVELLERRLTKLRATVKEMERALAELARRAAIDPGLSSIYRTVQGLAGDTQDREQKLALLTTIFEQNLALQHRVA